MFVKNFPKKEFRSMQNLLWLLLLLEGFVFLLLLNSGTHSIRCGNRGLHWRVPIETEKESPVLSAESDYEHRGSVTLTGWQVQAEYTHVHFVLFPPPHPHFIKFATMAISIIFIKFSMLLEETFWGEVYNSELHLE